MNFYILTIAIPFKDVLREKEIVAHYPSKKELKKHLSGKYTGWKINNCIEIKTPCHFVRMPPR